MKVVMASNNAHKIAELRAILSAYGLDVVSQREAGVHVEPEETGTTFEENSRIKAVAVMQACGLSAVADDSGLMVDALNGEPGVYSARYGGPDCISDSDRIDYLLKKLENVPEGKRTAKIRQRYHPRHAGRQGDRRARRVSGTHPVRAPRKRRLRL